MKSIRITWLYFWDITALALVTVLGFASHGTLDSAGLRVLTTFIPLVISWFLIAPHLGVYDYSNTIDVRQLWRPFWAMVLAAPFAAWLRGLWLQSAILPVFVLVLGGVSSFSMLIWRLIYFLLASRKRSLNG